MRKDEVEHLHNIHALATNQTPLLELPQSPQQQFLHLFAHRHLIDKKLFHRCLDRVRPLLHGTFAQSALETAVISCFLEHGVDCSAEKSILIRLIEQWVNYYPSLRNAKRDCYIFSEIVLQDQLETSAFGGLTNYLTYLNIISADLWRILRRKKSDQQFALERALKEELVQISKERCGQWLNGSDLLTFVSGCIPKTLLNIIMTSETLPSSMKKRKSFECLYVNSNIQFILRRSTKLAMLIRQILMVLLTMDLESTQQRLLMLVTMRFYYLFHYARNYTSTELVVHAFNKLTQETRKALSDEFALFFKIILKLGKEKFVQFIGKNSPFANKIVEMVMRRPSIGYPQESASPHSTAGVPECIDIERGATISRTFEVFEDYSIFFFRIQVVSLDITVRLFYLGEMESEKQAKKLLLTHEKTVGELKSSINAVKRGLYLFEFDNSFSWLNSKRIRYQNEVLTPLQIKTLNADKWIPDFYQNTFRNEVVNEEEEIVVIDTSKPEKSKQAEPTDKNKDQGRKKSEGGEQAVPREKEVRQGPGVVAVDRRQQFIRVVVTGRNEQYIYETDNSERMLQKIQKLSTSKEKYRWRFEGRPTNDLKEVQDFIQGEETQPRPPAIPKEEIDAKEFDEYENEGEAEYEVVERNDLERSQIFNESSGVLKTEQNQSGPSSKGTIEASASQLQQASC